MLQIVTDSSSLYSPKEAAAKGFSCLPLHIIADQKSYRDYEEIDAASFREKTAAARKLSTSQPSIGEKMSLYNSLLQDPDAEILDLSMADGLSGTYQSALMARDSCDDPDRVTVFNTRTLCAPHRVLVDRALDCRDRGLNLEETLKELSCLMQSASCVAAEDFEALAKGGRLPQIAGRLGSLVRLKVLAGQSEDGSSLKLAGTGRTWKKMFELADGFLRSMGMDETWTLFLVHGNNLSAANHAREYFQDRYPDMKIETSILNALFMVHGGNGCLAMQAVRMPER